MGKTSIELGTLLVGDDVGDDVPAALVGEPVGEAVGVDIGEPVGEAVGAAIGEPVGVPVGEPVGDAVGLRDGAFVASGIVGAAVVGVPVGLIVGDTVGLPVGFDVGAFVGAAVGVIVGTFVGEVVGELVGASVAAAVLGDCEREGISEGISVGAVLGESCQEISLCPQVSPDVRLAQQVTTSVPVTVPSFSRRSENGSVGLDSVEATIPSLGPPPVVVQDIGKKSPLQQDESVPPDASNVAVIFKDAGPEVVTVWSAGISTPAVITICSHTSSLARLPVISLVETKQTSWTPTGRSMVPLYSVLFGPINGGSSVNARLTPSQTTPLTST
mmetsp:Transcript_45403/g.67420  ORF Transcript_45403/g.67420 Transcript_45403/m.67420 type:complete len:329 (-) Transcript_45403:1575-2561(-)